MTDVPVNDKVKLANLLGKAFANNIGGKLDGEMVANALMARQELLSSLIDPRRDVAEECHYPKTTDIQPEQYKELFDRDSIANRVVSVLPKECWQVQPSVFEAEDSEVKTPFEEAWDALQPTTGGVSWYKSEAGGSVWEYLERLDVLSRIGHFGVLLMGFDDGKNLQEPVDGAMVTNSYWPSVPGEKCNQRMPDCYLTKDEEDNLRNLPNLNKQEEAVLNQLARQREMTLNYMQARQDIRERPQQNPVFGSTTSDEHDPNSLTGVQGTDKQYSQEFGMLGEAQYSPGLSGTDQQYFGVQFGPSEQPVKHPSKRQLKLLFLRPFDESLVQIVRYEWNISNPRFGMPVMYRITLNDPREQHSGIGLPMATVFVHWSRVIHVNDVHANAGSSEIFSPPAMRPVLNNLLNLQKIYGASPEGYWQAAFTGISLETHPQLGGDVEIDDANVRNQIENYVNSLQRYLALTGMSAHTLAPTVTDPTAHVAAQMDSICIQLGIPIRVFKGSERGELASSQDDASWNDRLKGRQIGYITPRIIAPFVDRLISVGVLPEPNYVEPVEPELDEFGDPTEEEGYENEPDIFDGEDTSDSDEDVSMGQQEAGIGGRKNTAEQDEGGQEEDRSPRQFVKNQHSSPILNDEGKQIGTKTATGYSVVWPDLDSNTDLAKAQIASTKIQAVAAYVSGNCESVIPLNDFFTRILGMTDEEAAPLVKAAEEQQALMEQEQSEQQQQFGDQYGGEQQEQGQFGQDDQQQEQELSEEGKNSIPPQLQQNAFCATGEGGGVDPSCSVAGMATSTAASTLKDLGYNDLTPKTLAPRMQESLATELAAAKDLCPGLEKHLSSIRATKLPGRTLAKYTTELGSRAIYVADVDSKAYEKLNKTALREQKSGYLSSEDGVRGLLAHEIGHAINMAPHTMVRDWPGVIAARTYLRQHPPTAKDLSEYAVEPGQHQKEEAFAEAYAAMRTVKSPNAWQQGFNTAIATRRVVKNRRASPIFNDEGKQPSDQSQVPEQLQPGGDNEEE